MGILWAFIALGILGLLAGVVGWLQSKYRARRIALGLETEQEEVVERPHGEGCCGMHITCEEDSLLAAVSKQIDYFDDEELDRYIGIASTGYSSQAVDEFHEVLVTLQEGEVPAWVRSLQLRGIELPEELKPEVFLVVGEQREHDHLHH